ncbi:MAG: HAD family hydrolase [Methanobacteriota archaeon]|nr:MAG: HAD family hydrolase [Euryarchaeota archaeon]
MLKVDGRARCIAAGNGRTLFRDLPAPVTLKVDSRLRDLAVHVLLDLYGVLLDHEKMFRGYRERLAELLAARFGGTPETWRRAHDEAWVTYVQRVNSVDWESRGYADIVDELDARHLLEIFERVGVTGRPADTLAVSREFEREAMSHVNARYSDARTAIERLRSAGHRVYVATGGSETNDAALRGAGLFDLIDRIFTGHSQNAQKGQSRYWQEIPHQLGVKPRDCVLVDDRLDYLEAAASVGIVALLLDRKAAHRPESMPPYVEATLRNLAGLPHWVELWTATRHD